MKLAVALSLSMTMTMVVVSARGADTPPSESTPSSRSWQAKFAARKQWWSFQPVQNFNVPAGVERHPVDRFLSVKLMEKGLERAPQATRSSLLRRLSYDLTGLPPTEAELDAFERDPSLSAWEKQIDRLLASPRFGERWARRWMDLVRFAETHGSEGDPEIPFAWRYRDYLIRAFNQDLPYDQFVKEQIAGDLLPQPRWNQRDGWNESMLGIAQWRMMEHGFQPVDTLEDQVKVIDNQIDVAGKTFLGLTIACSRCHDHKFDPISQRDYFALYGIMASVRPGVLTIDDPAKLGRFDQPLLDLKARIKREVLVNWRAAVEQLFATTDFQSASQRLFAAAQKGGGGEGQPLWIWSSLENIDPSLFAAEWEKLKLKIHADHSQREQFLTAHRPSTKWFPQGATAPSKSSSGEFSVEPDGPAIFASLLPTGHFSHLTSQKHNGVLMSETFKVTTSNLSVRVVGGKGARVRLIPDHYPIGADGIFPQRDLGSAQPEWVRLDVSYRKGTDAYIEFVGAEDSLARNRAASVNGRSFYGFMDLICHDEKDPPKPLLGSSMELLQGDTPKSMADLRKLYHTTLVKALDAWEANRLSEHQTELLNSLIRAQLLSNHTNQSENLADLVAKYREIENKILRPTRSPGVLEAHGADAPLYSRGDHLKPMEKVSRGFLQVLGGTRYSTTQSGRMELAEDIANSNNPLFARVMVNRVWQALFARGLVRTSDNFGHLGEAPSHPELLDYLARRFADNRWSVKQLIRFLVTSQTYTTQTAAVGKAGEIDPENIFYSHMTSRRLEAEEIRDSLLFLARSLDERMFGPGANALAKPAEQHRRSVYLTVRRNFLNPFLTVFDAPKPFTTLGRRETTNVPAQSLALMNDPFVLACAKRWSEAVQHQETDAARRVHRMLKSALAREPAAEEVTASLAYLAEPDQTESWQDFAHSIFNMKEFIYLR